MIADIPAEAAQAYQEAGKYPLAPFAGPSQAPLLDRAAVERILPHRDPFRLVDQVSVLDLDQGLVVAHYDLAQAQAVFGGHFPQYPVWPGVLQAEAIGQAGSILLLEREEMLNSASVMMTHILGARYMTPVRPGGHVQICARVFDNDLFGTIVGQCLHEGEICSAAAVNIVF